MYTFGVVIHFICLLLYLFVIFKVKDNITRWVLLIIFCLVASNFIYCVKNGKNFTYRGRLTIFSRY